MLVEGPWPVRRDGPWRPCAPCCQSWLVVGGGIHFSGNTFPSDDAIREHFGSLACLIVNLNSGMPRLIPQIKAVLPNLRVLLFQESSVESAEGWGWDHREDYARAASACDGYLSLTHAGARWFGAWSGKPSMWLGVPGPQATMPPGATWRPRTPYDPWPPGPIVSIGNWPHHGRGAVSATLLALRAVPECVVRCAIDSQADHDRMKRIVASQGMDPERFKGHGCLGYAQYIEAYRNSTVCLALDMGTAWGRTATDLLALGIPTIMGSRCGIATAVAEWQLPGRSAFVFDPINEAPLVVDTLRGLCEDEHRRNIASEAMLGYSDALLSLKPCEKRLAKALGEMGGMAA